MKKLYDLFLKMLVQANGIFHKYPTASALIFVFYLVYIVIVFYDKKKTGHIRGAEKNSKKKSFFFNKKKQAAAGGNILLGDVELPREEENKMLFMFGRPGSGKSTLFNSIIEKLIERNEKGIIYDEKFDYIPMFYDPQKDLILNIADKRTLIWSISNEIEDKADLISVAKSLIPEAQGQEQHWNDTARGIFTAVAREFIINNQTKNSELFAALSQKTEDILEFLERQNAPEAVHISNPRNASDVMSTLMRYVGWLEYAADGDFSIRNWINNPESRFIFVANNQKIKDIQKPLLALFIDLFIKNVLSLPEDRSRRFYFLLDEIATLGRLSSVVDLFTQGRSKGMRAFCGIQDIGQFDRLYGRETRNTIVNACSNYVLLAQNEFENAKFASDLAGASESWQTSHHSNDMAPDGGSQASQQIKPLILPSEFQSMDNLTAYVRILKNWEFTQINIVDLPYAQPGFVLNDSFKFNKENS